ncbi:MAG: hypothetical protein QXG86_00625 [Candidatus Woesearchaeota archaeon]
MESEEKKYILLKGSRGFQKLTAEFLIINIAHNMQYIFLVMQILSIFNIVNFNLNPSYFPELSIRGEVKKVEELSFNPLYIYGHFLYVFYEVMKSVTLTFVDHLRQNIFTGGIIAILLVNIWLAYSTMNYAYENKTKLKSNIIFELVKKAIKEGNPLEDALWMMFVIDIVVFITTPTKSHIYFLFFIYLLILSVKVTPLLSNMIINASIAFRKSVFHNKKVLFVVTILDIGMVYFDSKSMFALFLMIIVYTGIATLVLKITEKIKLVNKIIFYLVYIGFIVFLGSIFVIYWISFILVTIVQLPILIYFYKKKKKFIPLWLMQLVNFCLLAVLVFFYFK